MRKKKEEIRMLTIREASEITGASQSSIRVWLSDEQKRQKRFPGARLEQPPAGSPYWLIPETDIARFEMGKPGPKPSSKKGKGKG
jgi:hypothetical protein